MVSQNAEQLSPATVNADNPANRFSYTRYDNLGRITEVGEKYNATTSVTISELATRKYSDLKTWMNSGTNRQVTLTVYDVAPVWAPAGIAQGNLRKRVAAVALLSTGNNAAVNREAASYYNYDITGNVKLLTQENVALAAIEKQKDPGSDGLKRIAYDYDLISGKVNKVRYQDGKWDQFYHYYRYDAENRLTDVYTNQQDLSGPNDINNWDRDAHYRYYLHGPLARTELGNTTVQGVDYAYTLQGWLKGVNSSDINKVEMTGDGKAGTFFDLVPKDVFGFGLYYYGASDYKPVGTSTANNPFLSYNTLTPLYNGNISGMAVDIPKISSYVMQNRYRYDQLNRLTAFTWSSLMNVPGGIGFTTSDYFEQVTYDGNGNILTYNRNGNNSLAMDQLSYAYQRDANNNLLKNRLLHIKDAVADDNYAEDIDNQGDNNYGYNKIGNLTKDTKEKITGIQWTVYGKIKKITMTGKTISYGYDAAGNRITKTVAAGSTTTTTFYSRDAQGNTMAVYTSAGSNFTWDEQHLYGSSRLGIWKPGIVAKQNGIGDSKTAWGRSGDKFFELSNHLGNVLATVSDKVTGVNNDSDPEADYYVADVVSANDYYPFGMLMPGRKFNAGSYRYGFNGKENDNEVKGDGNSVDFGDRSYDGRIGRWMTTDRLASAYPSITPYAYAVNSPVMFIDPNGKWVAKVDFDKTTKIYSLTFVAEKGDNLSTLALQLGIPKNSLLKSNPTLNTLKITTGSELKLEKIKEVSNINYAINFLGDDYDEDSKPIDLSSEQAVNNCANFANMASGNKEGLIRYGDYGENANLLAGRLGTKANEEDEPTFDPIMSESNSKMGDIMYYEAKTKSSTHLHFAIVVLKDKQGKNVKSVMQKHGTSNLRRQMFDPSKLFIPDTHIPYKKTKIFGAFIFRPKQTNNWTVEDIKSTLQYREQFKLKPAQKNDFKGSPVNSSFIKDVF